MRAGVGGAEGAGVAGDASTAPSPSALTSVTPNSMYGSSGSASSLVVRLPMSANGMLMSTETRTVSGGGSGVSGGFSVEYTELRTREVRPIVAVGLAGVDSDGAVWVVGSNGSRGRLRSHRSQRERGGGCGMGVVAGAAVGEAGSSSASSAGGGGFVHLQDSG